VPKHGPAGSAQQGLKREEGREKGERVTPPRAVPQPHFNKLMRRKWVSSPEALDGIVGALGAQALALRRMQDEPYQVSARGGAGARGRGAAPGPASPWEQGRHGQDSQENTRGEVGAPGSRSVSRVGGAHTLRGPQALVAELHRRALVEYVRPLLRGRLRCRSARTRGRVAGRLREDAAQLQRLFRRLVSAAPAAGAGTRGDTGGHGVLGEGCRCPAIVGIRSVRPGRALQAQNGKNGPGPLSPGCHRPSPVNRVAELTNASHSCEHICKLSATETRNPNLSKSRNLKPPKLTPL
jgi:hypothetical protein